MFEGLLLILACCTWEIVTGYSLTHTDDTEVSVLCPILFAVTLSYLSYGKKEIGTLINSVLALLVLFYIGSGFTWHGSLINILYPDIFLASINWKNKCRYVFNELLSITGYVLYYAYVFTQRYGRLRVAVFFMFNLFLSFLLPFIFVLGLTRISELSLDQINIVGWFGKQTFESDIQVPIDNSQIRYPTNADGIHVGEIDTYKLNNQEKYLNFSADNQNLNSAQYHSLRYENLEYIHVSKSYIDIVEREQALPVCEREFLRHVGEDIRLKCTLRFQDWSVLPKPPYLKEPKFYWMNRRSQLKPSDRFFIDIIPGKIRGDHSRWFRNDIYNDFIEILLDIYIIENDDFGEYQLWVDFISPWKSHQHLPNNVSRHIKLKRHRMLLAKFVLTETKLNVAYLKVPVGRMAHLRQLSFKSLADMDDLSIYHKIDSLAFNNSGDTDYLCPALFKGCGLFMAIFYFLSIPFENINDVVIYRLDGYSFSLDVMSCICHGAYGEHNVIIHREFYNRTAMRTVIIEIPHPSKYIILPSESLISTQNYSSKLYEETLSILQKEKTDKWKSIWEHHIPGEETVYDINLAIQFLLFFILLYYLLKFPMWSFKMYERYVVIPLKNIILGENRIAQIKKPDTTVYDLLPNHYDQILHDVLIINAEDDSDFVLNELSPFLEKKGLNVCVPDRDFNPGGRLMNLYHAAVRQSRLYITVCSEALVDSPILNQYVSDVMMAELFKNRAYKKSLFLKYGECDIPEALLMSSDLIDWTSQIETTIKFKRLSNWLTKNYRN